MVLCYEEKDRIAIESTGMRIIEHKRMMYKLYSMLQKIFQTLSDRLQKIYQTIRKVVDMVVDTVKEVFRSITDIKPRKRWKIVKSLIKAGLPCGMFFPNWRAYHCRNNC